MSRRRAGAPRPGDAPLPGDAPRLGEAPPPPALPGVRVVLDVRPLQEPERAPATAAYLDALLGAFDRSPIGGESFAFLLQSDLDDPTERFGRLSVIGRRLLPPTRLLRGGALTVDPILLSGASLGAAWRAEQSGAAGAVYHAAGGAVPLATGLPLVATLLDLAPWELPRTYQRGLAARFGQRLRARILRDAAAVIVGTEAVARDARRLLRLRRDRVRVVPFAARAAFVRAADGSASAPGGGSPATDARGDRERLGLPDRYLAYAARFDARQDLATLLGALAELASAGRPGDLSADVPWPPRVLLIGATPDDRAALARAAARAGIGEALTYAPGLDVERTASLVAGARAALAPARSDATGIAALEAIAAGTPVVASAVGALPEIVGPAGILVEPRDPIRLAEAIRTVWLDDALHGRLVAAARDRATVRARTWDDVAAETRAVYWDVGRPRANRD
ncbi:MAG TPA: glycosyltransferase [Candidatus Limnocylindrales bacterium]|nr:glycosyltransferase [Candidatus Limnocylindrales bacterium]